MLAVRSHERVWISTGARLRQLTAAQVAARRRRTDWQRLRAGEGAKGPRLYEGGLMPLVGPVDPGGGRGLLVRRSQSPPTALASDVVCGPVGTRVAERVRVAGSRWAIEERLETATGEVGLDHSEVRRWPGWYRPITLALLAHAYLTVTRAHAAAAAREKGGPCVLRRSLTPPACRRRS